VNPPRLRRLTRDRIKPLSEVFLGLPFLLPCFRAGGLVGLCIQSRCAALRLCYSDNSNAVGTKVATAGTRDIATIYAQSGTLTQATFSNLNINLATNTSYWVVVESNTGVEGSGMYWGHGGSAIVTNPTSAAGFNPATTPQWFTYPGASNPGALGMQVYASVPEPGTLLLGSIAATLGGCGIWRNRRNKPSPLPAA